MAEEQTPPVAPPAEPEQPAARRSRWRRFALGVMALLVAIIAAFLMAIFTVDLGPSLRKEAEIQSSKYLERPMRIGKLVAKLTPGQFEVHDVIIEGLTPTDRPFLRAKLITVSLPWWTAFTRKIVIESIDMTDWEMVVETWPSSPGFPNGRHNFPRIKPESKQPSGPKRWTTTLKWMQASRGAFTYEDHGTPWSTAARQLTVSVSRGPADTVYRGAMSFEDSIITIQSYQPFRANMQSRFTIDGSNILRFSRMDLTSAGARSAITGSIDLARWPEQTYHVKSRIDFPTQKEIFFHGQQFTASGQGDFDGTFHIFKGGRELKGTFASPMAGVLVGGNDWRFPNLRGSVLWLPDRLEITDATSGLYGGTAKFDYRLAPFGRTGVPTRAVWDVAYRDVDLAKLTDFLQTGGLRLAGRITGRNRLDWELGKWSGKVGGGDLVAQAPPGVAPMTRELRPGALARVLDLPPEAGPFNAQLHIGYVPIAGQIAYTLDPSWLGLGSSWVATPSTYVEFEGRTAYGQDSRIPFHVTSLDWQESDRVLAAIMTAFGAPTGAVEVGGIGEFDGVMLKSFTKPRIEGTFKGDRMRAWNVVWGKGHAKLAIENSYVEIEESALARGDSLIQADGKFSLGYPRKDAGEEINARVRMVRRPLVDLRHAFRLDDYPMEGLVSGEYHLYGKYETPFGFGGLRIDDMVAYGETFDVATAALRFEGAGVRLDSLNIQKDTGAVTGAAWVAWDGQYSFSADGTKIPVESLDTLSFPKAELSGVLHFSATGTGTFDEPRYDVTRIRIDDLFAGDEGIGQLNGKLSLRGDLLTGEFEVASPRLAVSGSGRIALTEQMDAELTLRFSNTSLDPYIRFFEPRLSPFTTAVAGGTVRVVGELTDVDHLVVDTRVDELSLKLFDYQLRNDGPIELSLDQHVAEIGRLRVVGDGTQLDVNGTIDLHRSTISVQAAGDANLSILQGFYRDIRSSGAATLKAAMDGPLSKPVFSGSATIAGGRVRPHPSMPSLEAINGTLTFDASAVRINDVRARLGDGDVVFGGRIAMNGFVPGVLSLTAVGNQMRLRYPEGFVSVIDADLTLRGDLASPALEGNVTVHDARYTRRFDPTADIFNLSGSSPAITGGGAPVQSFPLRLNIDIVAQQSLRVENNLARLVSSADLQLLGTYDKPILNGRAEIDRGDIIFEGNRYIVTRGTINFSNPTRIEPYFDIEAETRVRVPRETYRVTLGLTGTFNRVALHLDSDPPLSEVDIVSLLLGQTQNLQDAELRTLNPGASGRAETDLLVAAAARALTGPISAPVGLLFQQALGIDFQIAPSLGSESDPLTPTARVVLGRRLSDRAYVTFSRALGATVRDQIVVLEYDQSDRVGWVLTQNQATDGRRTYAIDFRVRHVF